MNLFLKYVFLFFLGACFGWILELFFRRIVHGKWVNPGFLSGPYLPIYGFGVVFMTIIITVFKNLSPFLIIIMMGITMTLIELVGGLMLLKQGLMLWDYSDRFLNYKGIICPLFSLLWTVLCALYYFFINSYIDKSLIWFSNNLAFSFVLGFLFCLIIIDYIYSNHTISKIRAFAKDNNIKVKLEEFRKNILDYKAKRKEKFAFINGLSKLDDMSFYLKKYKHKKINKK